MARMITIGNRTMTLAAWAREAGMSPEALSSRIKNGWPSEQAVSIKTHAYHRHGHASQLDGKSSIYRIWQSMHHRCSYPKDSAFKYYGGRGIRVCERWSDFRAFLADMGPRPPGMSIDRKDNDGNYEPSNCRWATAHEQMRNSRSVRVITFNGESLCVRDWEERLGLSQGAIYHRIRKGWSIQRALTTPRLNGRGKA